MMVRSQTTLIDRNGRKYTNWSNCTFSLFAWWNSISAFQASLALQFLRVPKDYGMHISPPKWRQICFGWLFVCFLAHFLSWQADKPTGQYFHRPLLQVIHMRGFWIDNLIGCVSFDAIYSHVFGAIAKYDFCTERSVMIRIKLCSRHLAAYFQETFINWLKSNQKQ